VNGLDEAGESNQQNTQQRERRNASVSARSVWLRKQIKQLQLRIDYYTGDAAQHVTSGHLRTT
jgi:hypothetical protein